MTLNLRDKLILSFVFVIVVSLTIAGLLANQGMIKHFDSYLESKREEYSRNMVKILTENYEEEGEWGAQTAHLVVWSGMQEGYRVKLLDQNRQIVWESFKNRNGLGLGMHRRKMVSELSDEVSYLAKTYPIKVDGGTIGYLEVSYLRPGVFVQQDQQFIQALNKSLILSAVIGIVFALIISLAISSDLSNPIRKIAQLAERIRDGDLSARFVGKDSTKELASLAGAINSLGSTLEKQEMLRHRLTSDVAHELRTPLATLQSHLEALVDGIWEPSKEKLESCHQEVLRLSRLVASLEHLNKLDDNLLSLKLERVHLRTLLQTIITNFQPQYDSKGVELSSSFKGDPSLLLDQDKFTQIIVNLLSNSLKFTPPRGQVKVEMEEREDKILIQVRDSGLGISSADLPHIFQRFYRGEKSRSRETGGAGIGLAITKALVEVLGGKIEAESQLEVGSTFTLNFPKN